MKSSFILFIFLLSSQLVLCQDIADTVEVRPSFNAVFKKNGQKLKPRDLLELTRSNPEAYQEMRIAKSNYDASQVLGYVGGFLVGWPLGTALGGGKPNWTLAAVGGGLLLISLPFSSEFSKHAMKSMSIYNNDIKQNSQSSIKMKLGLSPTGIRLEMKI
jgi:hypothetical protein